MTEMIATEVTSHKVLRKSVKHLEMINDDVKGSLLLSVKVKGHVNVN